jgi:tetratricopeptide (TPR) repeat protein
VAHKNLAIALVKRAEAAGEVPPWDEAAGEFAQALDLLEDNPSTISLRKTACRELAPWQELFERVAKLRPDEASIWTGHAAYSAQCSQWDAALADYKKVIDSRELHDDIFEYGCLLLMQGDEEGYEKFCQQLGARPRQMQDVPGAYIMARLCAVRPSKSVNPANVLGWIAQLNVREATAYRLHVLGLASYRAGQYQEAIAYLNRSNAARWTEAAKSMNFLVLAMAQHQLGQADEAAQSLETARKLIALAAPKKAGEPVDLFAPDWIEYQVLVREAEALLKPAVEGKAAAGEK